MDGRCRGLCSSESQRSARAQKGLAQMPDRGVVGNMEWYPCMRASCSLERWPADGLRELFCHSVQMVGCEREIRMFAGVSVIQRRTVAPSLFSTSGVHTLGGVGMS